MQSECENLSFLAGADEMVSRQLSGLLEPIIIGQKVESVKDWVCEKMQFIEGLNDQDLHSYIQRREPLWQVAALTKLAREKLIQTFQLHFHDGHTDKLTALIRPLADARVIQIPVAGVKAPQAVLN